MVEQNYILYVNKKNHLRAVSVALVDTEDGLNFNFSIPEKHLICGLILNGIPIKGDLLKDFPFKPIEKYLFEFTNIHFVLPEMEFNQENLSYDFEVQDLDAVAPPPYDPYIVDPIYAITYYNPDSGGGNSYLNSQINQVPEWNPDIPFADLRLLVNGVDYGYVFSTNWFDYSEGYTFNFTEQFPIGTKFRIVNVANNHASEIFEY